MTIWGVIRQQLENAIARVENKQPHVFHQMFVGGQPTDVWLDFTAAGKPRLWKGRGPRAVLCKDWFPVLSALRQRGGWDEIEFITE